MTSAGEAADRILSRLRVEKTQEDTSEETTCSYDCSSKSQTFDRLNEYVQRLDSDLMAVEAKTEAQRDDSTRLGSLYRSLRYDCERDKREFEQIKEIVGIHGARLDDFNKRQEGLHLLTCENVAKTDKLEEQTNDLYTRLYDEKRQRKKSDSNLWLFIGSIAFLWLLNTHRLGVTTSPTPQVHRLPVQQRPTDANSAARAYVMLKTFGR